MRTLFLFCCSLLLSNSAWGNCLDHGLRTFPDNGRLATNSSIVLGAYENSQEILDDLEGTHLLYLKAKDHMVLLQVVERNTGMFHVSQVILEPTETLHLGKTYQLKLKGPNRDWTKEVNEEYSFSWRTFHTNDHLPPIWIEAPTLTYTFKHAYGCGPVEIAQFCFPVAESSQFLAKVELVKQNSEWRYSYTIPVYHLDRVEVGHGMCSGPFDYLPHTRYKVRFSLCDLNGNTDHQWTDWIAFDSPADKQPTRP